MVHESQTFLVIYLFGTNCEYTKMKIRDARYLNTRALILECGSLNAFAKRIGKADTQVSSFAGDNPRKGIGNKIAEEIEGAFGKPTGWLDIPPENRYISELTALINSVPDDMRDAALSSAKQILEVFAKRAQSE